jgi:orotidine-5'-phosphate decarboxylase
MDGVVCSAQEAAAVRQACGAGFRLVTPGIRPAQAGEDDQKRVATPGAAVANGADYLVIGRPITRAPDPLAALAAIEAEIAGGGPG